MWENGLMSLWGDWFRPIPGQCLGNIKTLKKAHTHASISRLSLKNLTGAFVALLFGYCLSLLVYAGEHLYSVCLFTLLV